MKKTVIIALFLTSLVSCSNNAITEQAEKSPIITETTSEETTQEIEIPPATERETINEVLYEDENVAIFYNGYDSFPTVQRVYFTIENKTANKIQFDTLDFKANGIPINEVHGGKVEAHETVSPEWTLLNSRFQEANISRVTKLEFKLHLLFSDIEQYDTDIITIER